MDWNDLRYVIAIAEQGSLKAAAEHIGVNHSTAWRRIQGLEEQLGCQIFIADRQGYRLTDAGLEVLESAKKMASHVEAIQLSTHINKKDMQGLIRLTAPNTMASRTLPEMIYKFNQKYPLVEFEIIEGIGDLDLGKREADIAIRANMKAPENVIARKLKQAPWAFFAHPDLVPKQKMDLELLRKQPLIGYKGFEPRPVKWFRQNVSSGPYSITCNNVETAKGCAKNKLGIALLPALMSTELVEVYRLPNEFSGYIWLLAHPEMRKVVRVKAFWDFLLEQNEKGMFLS
ncbi:LysR family transcriptional regulator [Vibrio lamellibrachiae]|uniref:LysR family transcriptional regulator n=1 Tax=Vibrio lamellibrachiae TaxID=2910253 RepID=UPI003D0FE1CF